MYQWRTDLRGRGVRPAPEAMRDLKSHLPGQALDLWRARLDNPTAGHRAVEAIRPVFDNWVNGPHDAVTYRRCR